MAQLDRGYVKKYRTAADKGRPDAQLNLGLMYSTGQGVPLDLIRAHKWLNLAAMSGIGEARTLRAELARDMSKEEVSEAQRKAREWILTH